jgi:glycosyltransferase involved in cell wall biosynthesis
VKTVPLVSIITIFRNEERFLPEAVESVLAQSYPNWELLLCDDGSTDESPALARAYARSHPGRIRFLQHPDGENRGMSATRNMGLAHARGDLIALLDGDDVYMQDKLARQAEILQTHPEAVMVYGPTCFWQTWPGSPPGGSDSYSRMPVRKPQMIHGKTMLRQVLRGRCDPPATCSVLVRRDAIDSIGGFEDRFHDLFEDQVFFAKLLLGSHLYVTDECHDRYRQHADSTCSIAQRSGLYHPDASSPARVRYLEWLKSYAAISGTHGGLRRLVGRELWLSRRPALARIRSTMRHGADRMAAAVWVGAFKVGRVLLPKSLRSRLWDRWIGERR